MNDDPHFLVEAGNAKLCYDVYGRDGKVLQLYHNSLIGECSLKAEKAPMTDMFSIMKYCGDSR